MTHPIPREALDDRHAFVGTAGSGKTYSAGTAVERVLHAKGRVVIIDPLGVWWGLRLTLDGQTPSPFRVVIFGGAHGDLPINEHAGALIGETVAGMAESCIIDLSGIGTKAGERRFMLAFLTSLYRKTTGEPVHIVLDEADMFAPQRLLDKEGEAAKLLGMMETIVRRGRVKGFIPWLITQRPAVLSKDVLSQADGLVAFKLTSSQDRDAIGAWIEGQADKATGKEMLASLPGMQVGQAVVWIPGRGVLSTEQFPHKATFDSSRTPKRGETVRAATLKPIDLGALKERLATVEAEFKANDPVALKARIRELEKRQPEKAIEWRIPDEVAQQLYRAGFTDGWKDRNAAFRNVIIHHKALLDRIDEMRDLIARRVTEYESMAGVEVPSSKPVLSSALPKIEKNPASTRFPKSAPQVNQITKSPLKTANGHDLTGPQTRIMASLAFWNVAGHPSPTREQVALVAGYSARGAAFRNPLSGLKTLGMVDYPTPGTIKALQAVNGQVPDIGDARAAIRGCLSGPQIKILDAVIEGAESREVIAQRAGYSAEGAAFRNPLSGLRTLRIIDYPSPGEIALTD